MWIWLICTSFHGPSEFSFKFLMLFMIYNQKKIFFKGVSTAGGLGLVPGLELRSQIPSADTRFGRKKVFLNYKVKFCYL